MPFVKSSLELMYDYLLAEFGFIVYAPKMILEYSVKTEGFGDIYEIFYPQWLWLALNFMSVAIFKITIYSKLHIFRNLHFLKKVKKIK